MASVTGDFSKGKVSSAILRIGLPMMAAEFVNVLYNLVDRMYIGHLEGTGTVALTGIGICFPLISLISAFAGFCGSGGAPLSSIARGAGQDEKAKRIQETAFTLMLLVGLFLTLLLFPLASPLLRLLGGDDETLPYALSYFRIYVLGSVPVLITLGMNSFINAQGFSKTGMLTVVISAVINIILDPVMIFGLLGFLDDFIKLKGNKDGLKPRYKLLGQLVFGCIVGLTLWISPQAVVRENVERVNGNTESTEIYHKSEARKSTVTTVPFFKNNNLDYYEAFSFIKDGKTKRACGWILFILVTTFVITAVSNGANLNDGMDGMCAGNSAIIGTTLGILAYVSGHIQFADYLNVMYIPGSEEIVVFMCASVGALIISSAYSKAYWFALLTHNFLPDSASLSNCASVISSACSPLSG